MSEILSGYTIVTPGDEGIDFNPEETGSTFYENSLIKARALWHKVHAPVLADDSGICVDALGGRPGIYSARYAGPLYPNGTPDGKKTPQAKQNEYLVEELNAAIGKGVDIEKGKALGLFRHGLRSAHYTCAMVLLIDRDRFVVAEETMEGSIVSSIEEARGNGGFGYDPLFLLPDGKRTSAQLTDEEKNAISHRGKATRIIIQAINSGILNFNGTLEKK